MGRIFYRYIRPVKFNSKRMDFDTLPNGGICLRFERMSGSNTLFTYSRCHGEDHFNKVVAKKIADERAERAKSDARLLAAMSPDMDGIGESAEELCYFLIAYCDEFSPADYPFLVAHYLSIEWKGFVEALEKIMKQNQREIEMGQVWFTAAGAMEMAERYADNSIPLQ